MQNADYLRSLVLNAVNGDIWQAAEYELAGISFAACSAGFRKVGEQVDLLVN
jgi:hypothetical protein